LSANAQVKLLSKNDTLQRNGIVVPPNRFSKQFSILMRDTTLSGNRFDYRWHKGTDLNGRVSSINYQLPAFLVDSTLAAYCDSMLIFAIGDKQIRSTSYPKNDLSTLTKKNVRLYAGYIDDEGNRNIVVQFISPKEFKRLQRFYLQELFLVVPTKELHFAIIKI